jgi:hypothetical protein
MGEFHLYDFLAKTNSNANVKCFFIFEVVLQVVLICLTLARAIHDGYGWSYVVFTINLFNLIILSIDSRYFGFGNSISLFFVLTSESVSLAANILICFVGTRLMRATSLFVLVLWFLQKGAFAAYITSTILRAIHGIREGLRDMQIDTGNDDTGTSVIVKKDKEHDSDDELNSNSNVFE